MRCPAFERPKAGDIFGPGIERKRACHLPARWPTCNFLSHSAIGQIGGHRGGPLEGRARRRLCERITPARSCAV